MFSKICGFTIFALLLTTNLNANEKIVFLAKISTDLTSKTYDLNVITNEQNQIQAIQTKNNKKNKIKTYKTDVLSRPIVLVKTMGIELVSLQCKGFNHENGCEIEIEYPYNLTYGKFKNFHAKLEKKDGAWVLTKDGNIFKKMHLKAKKLIGILVGVKRIETSQ